MPTAFPLGHTVFFVDTVAPTVTSDLSTIGARAGYWWLNSSTNIVYICLSAVTGAAVWQQSTSSSRAINTSNGITGGGDLTADRTLSLTGVALALHTNTSGPGTDGFQVPRAIDLGGAAFVEPIALSGIFAVSQSSNYQLTITDLRKLIIATASTLTFTLPRASDIPNGWWCLYRNRSGVDLSIVRTGADTINAGLTVVSVATATPIGHIIRTSNSSFEVG